MNKKLKEDIEKYALQNALKFKGKANPGAVIGKLLADNQKNKEHIKEIAKEIAYEKTEQDFLARGLATQEEIERWQKNRELSERFGIELNY